MREVYITGKEEGQRLDKFLQKYMSLAGKSFLYKMMRKKNITLNGKKASGSEKLAAGDTIRLFLARRLRSFQVLPPGRRCRRAAGIWISSMRTIRCC